MKALTKKEIISQLSKLGIYSSSELEIYLKEYKAYYSQHHTNKIMNMIYNKLLLFM